MSDRNHMQALRLFSRVARSAEYRKYRARVWGHGGDPIPVVPATSTDKVLEVNARVKRTGAPRVQVAVYYPDQEIVEVVELLTGTAAPEEADDLPVGEGATVAALIDLLRMSGRPVFARSASDVLV